MRLKGFLIWLFGIANIYKAAACSCSSDNLNTFSIEKFNKAHAIAMITLIAIDKYKDDGNFLLLTFELQHQIKGLSPKKIIAIADNYTTCMSEFYESDINRSYLYFWDDLFISNDTLLINFCSEIFEDFIIRPHEWKFIEEFEKAKEDRNEKSYKNIRDIVIATGRLDSIGRPVGYWKYYFINGDLSSEGNYENGLKEGEWKNYKVHSNKCSNNNSFYFLTLVNSYEAGLPVSQNSFDEIGNLVPENELTEDVFVFTAKNQDPFQYNNLFLTRQLDKGFIMPDDFNLFYQSLRKAVVNNDFDIIKNSFTDSVILGKKGDTSSIKKVYRDSAEQLWNVYLTQAFTSKDPNCNIYKFNAAWLYYNVIQAPNNTLTVPDSQSIQLFDVDYIKINGQWKISGITLAGSDFDSF